MNKKRYNLREKRLVEYIGVKRIADIVIEVRKEIERYRLDALPSDVVQALLLHVGETIQLHNSACVCMRCGNAEHVSQAKYCKICGIELFLVKTE
ncbi:hypothetical protein COC69_00070 [Bacillus cereus]|uniref:Uncharacterized protein n=1 Tax=Bacillus cereus TaxID=1396 RepID=A0A9X7CSQ7_BACCE|nr:hypothetical protein [Bacillus cereus]PGS84210.1 hypothetical protein COC69_00070 [Bacillus cereus]